MQKLMTRQDRGRRFSAGMAVTMTDGWRGTIEQDCGDFIVALRDGERSCPHWSGDYRLVPLAAIEVKANKLTVAWRSRSRRSARRSRSTLDGVVDDFRLRRARDRARLEQEWGTIS
jgi:hypothetical protein